ncbi:MAG: PD-(D/E)XK nuclease family protein [Fibrobacteres bacterium]|nr:PD-(D/E)XK nuclease family protein [Fibrobacterota bacterium]
MITLKETSWSSLNTYRSCPRKWHYSYVSDVPKEFEPVSLRYGSGVHSACEAYFKGLKRGQKLTAFNMARVVVNTMEEPDIRYGVTTKSELIEMANRFFQELTTMAPPADIIEVEKEHTYDLAPDFKLLMKIDLLTKDANGNLVVTDFKTSSKRMNGDAATSGQMSAYSLLYPQAKLRFVVFLKTKKGGIDEVFTERTHAQRVQIIRDFCEFKKEVENPDNPFIRIPSWACKSCQFQTHCQGGCQ